MRTLFISINLPCPPTGGDRQRTDLLYRALSELGDVDYLLCRSSQTTDKASLATLAERYRLVAHLDMPARGTQGMGRLVRPLAPGIIDGLAYTFGSTRRTLSPITELADQLRLTIAANQYDLIVCRYLPGFAATAPWGQVPVIVDVDDYPPQVYAQRLEQPLPAPRRIAYRHRLQQLQHHLPPLLQHAAHLWIPNPRDRAAIDHPSVSILPNIPYVSTGSAEALPAPVTRPDTIAMVGSLNYRVNVDGLEFFLEAVWPLIRTRNLAARFQIIGNGLTDTQRSKWSAHEGVEVVGFVEDLDQAYARCAFCIVPLQLGGGTKIKVIEALKHGRTVVLTTPALRGFEHVLKDEQSLLVRDDARSLADACLLLLADAGRRDQLSRMGHDLVKQHFSFEGFAQTVAGDVQSIQAAR